MNKTEAFWQLKQELTRQKKLFPPFWYVEDGTYGSPNLQAIWEQLAPGNPKLREILGAIAKPEQSALASGTETGQKVFREISDAFNKPRRPLTSTKAEPEPNLVPADKEWQYEIRRASGIGGDYLSDRPILLIDHGKTLQASAMEELQRACEQFYGNYTRELDKASRDFLALMEPKQEFTASVQDYDFGNFQAKSMEISGTLLELSKCNKNGWAISKEEAENLSKTLVGKVITIGVIDDDQICKSIRKGYLKSVSVGASGVAVCHACGKTWKTCDCKNSWQDVKNCVGNEISIITKPAYGETSKIEQFTELED